MNRKLLWAFLVIGVVLFAMPLVISMPAKAGAGETMMQNFQPIMQPGQVQETVRRVLGTYRGTAPGFPVYQNLEPDIEFVLGETMDPCDDPLTASALKYARAYIYGREADGAAVYLGQRYIWNRYDVSGDQYTFGTAEFRGGKWMAVSLNCNVIPGYVEPEPLSETLPDRPPGA